MNPVRFPNAAADGYVPHSLPDTFYNCIAFAAGVISEWWQPKFVWPEELDENDESMDALVRMYRLKGFVLCEDGQFESGYEKIALYGEPDDYQHAAKQLPDGRWASKLGKGEDIIHPRPETVAGGLYGSVLKYMKRKCHEPLLQFSTHKSRHPLRQVAQCSPSYPCLGR